MNINDILWNELETPVAMPAKAGFHESIPVVLECSSQGSMKKLRLKTYGDVVAEKRGKEVRPSSNAIRMANALLVEQILLDGDFKNPAALAKTIGVSRDMMYDLLRFMEKTPQEIESQLFEVV